MSITDRKFKKKFKNKKKFIKDLKIYKYLTRRRITVTIQHN